MFAATCYFSGNLFFVLAGSADVQPWNTPSPKSTKGASCVSSGKRHRPGTAARPAR